MRQLRRLSARSARTAKKRLLEAYAKLGSMSAAAEATGINRHHHKYWMKQSAEYREAFQAAEDEATEVLEREARRRAFEGREEPVFWNGQQIGTVRKPSDLLLIFLLKAKKPDIYREIRTSATANVAVQTAVKIVHEFHEAPPHADVTSIETLPNRQLMGPTELPTITEDKAGSTAQPSRQSTPQRQDHPVLAASTGTEDEPTLD